MREERRRREDSNGSETSEDKTSLLLCGARERCDGFLKEKRFSQSNKQ